MKAARWFLVLVFLMPTVGWAFEMPEISVHGFVSQGYLNSNDNNFLAPDSTRGTAELTEAGLMVSSQVTDKLHLGVQFLSRDLGNVGNNSVKLDWGFADYSFNDYVGLRVGKVKLPLGLYNEGRDTDMLRPTVFLPQSIYDETRRDLLVAYQGGGLYGTLPAGPLGYFNYHVYGGGINIDDDSLLLTALKQNGIFTIRKSLMPSMTVAFGGGPVGQAAASNYLSQLNITSLDIDNNYIAGGSLIFNTALDGLRLGASAMTVKNDISYVLNRSTDPADAASLDALLILVPEAYTGTLDNKLTWVASLEYTLGNFVLASEYSETKREQVFNGLVATDATSQSYYVMGAYTFNNALTLSLLYDVYYMDKSDKDGTAFVAANPTQRKDYFAWRKDCGVGMRYDINSNWMVKAEYHRINGAALFLTTVNDPTQLKEDWDYYAVKMSYNF